MAPSQDFASHQTSSSSLPSSVPVLIVGGGPTGLLQALLLSRLGVQSLIIERYPERLAAPKAHAINPRSLEILRQFDLGEKRVRQLGTSRDDSSSVNFLTNLCEEAIGQLPYERMDPAVLDDTPEMIHNIPQPVLEQELSNSIAKDPNITLVKGFSIHAVEQTENEVVSTIEERSTGQLHQTKSRHLIACDGRRSKVRELLGIESESEDSDQTMMTIHFNANLRPVVGDRVGMLYWIMDPIAAGFIIGYDLDGIQVHISQVDVEEHPVESWTEDMCRAKIRGAIGKDDVPFDILSYRPWVFRRQVAFTFQERNIFLWVFGRGCCPLIPPTGGLGLNCGLADVHNLAYKIALVHRGVATPSILSTYTAERRGVADSYSKQSVKNGKEIFALLQSLKTAGVEDVAQARMNMMAALVDPIQRKRVEAGIEGQREHFDNLELHIGYVYGATKPPPHASYYSPKFVPGARLPHAWIRFRDRLSQETEAVKRSALPREPVDVSYIKEFDADQVRACQWSTLDLCGPDSWTLILGQEQQTPQVTLLQKHCKVIGVPLNTWSLGVDFEIVRQGWFADELAHGGGILVRPDQHVFTRVAYGEDMIAEVNKHLGI
ncbi:Monooxygenase FAD-binding [Penicillium coprophilum]|uniref:Monooxygenase FAD-binding n=1 Tax=Penicillium coprophilum TaxID=36646 RepID=UPI00238E9EA2|nr:Monooxygenase FAD-binding [Penicillium coprophilum]KAJ5162604.1 Monooxygenase FAD-binding [Penicillium coprophilum]